MDKLKQLIKQLKPIQADGAMRPCLYYGHKLIAECDSHWDVATQEAVK